MGPPPQPGNPNPTPHPVLRQLLTTFAMIAIPLAEAFLAGWLRSKGIMIDFPPIGASNAKTGDSGNPVAPPGG
jgi:hypothetical protein